MLGIHCCVTVIFVFVFNQTIIDDVHSSFSDTIYPSPCLFSIIALLFQNLSEFAFMIHQIEHNFHIEDNVMFGVDMPIFLSLVYSSKKFFFKSNKIF